MKRRGWDDLSRQQKRGIGLLGLVQFALLLFALQDWIRRPDDQIRGRKKLWFPALFVNFVGPVAYLVVGRRR
ncbi:MAG: PLDc N-terminal domain-containing protein [Dehalococcoidia bacterium]|nr:PLDc N-terminal domain-containing protein [Dehalococcoidia bacterium]